MFPAQTRTLQQAVRRPGRVLPGARQGAAQRVTVDASVAQTDQTLRRRRQQCPAAGQTDPQLGAAGKALRQLRQQPIGAGRAGHPQMQVARRHDLAQPARVNRLAGLFDALQPDRLLRLCPPLLNPRRFCFRRRAKRIRAQGYQRPPAKPQPFVDLAGLSAGAAQGRRTGTQLQAEQPVLLLQQHLRQMQQGVWPGLPGTAGGNLVKGETGEHRRRGQAGIHRPDLPLPAQFMKKPPQFGKTRRAAGAPFPHPAQAEAPVSLRRAGAEQKRLVEARGRALRIRQFRHGQTQTQAAETRRIGPARLRQQRPETGLQRREQAVDALLIVQADISRNPQAG